MNGDDDAGHPLAPRNVLNDGGLFDLAGELEHGVQAGPAGEGDIFNGADDDEQRVRIEEVNVPIGKENEERHAHGDGGHQIRQEGHRVDVVCPSAPPRLGYGVADHGADGAGQQGAAHGHQDRSAEGVPDGLVVQDALLAVHSVFRDVLVRRPPFDGQVVGVSGV